MLPKHTPIFVSFHPDDENLVLSALSQVRTAGWENIIIPSAGDISSVSQLIGHSEMVLIFISKMYARDDRLMLEEFAYASVVVRKPFIPVWLESLDDIRKDHQSVGYDQQLLSTLEMLTAKHTGTMVSGLVSALEQFTPSNPPYTPSTPQVCEKPCEAYEGDEPYIFISYAHDDAKRVYPIIKELYEAGWDLWYDEGIKTTERYLPVIANNLSLCAAVVLMLTNRCLERPFVMNYELEYARQLGVPVIPVLLEELYPLEYAREVAVELLKDAIAPDALLGRVAAETLPKRGTREAVPPAIRQNVVYDVVLPPEVPGFEFTVSGDEITLIKYVGTQSDIVIPYTVKTSNDEMIFRVTAIGNTTFKGCSFLRSVVIPEGVTRIGDSAFNRCTSLTNISIPETITIIGVWAFSYCTSLTDIKIPANINSISGFGDCSSLTSIVIPEGVTSIVNMAFQNCTSLTSVTISESVKSIGHLAFGNCKSLTNVVIPKSVIYIADTAFYNTPMKILGIGSLNDIQNEKPLPLDYLETKQALHNHPEIPYCEETPRALICCAEEDLQHIRTLLIELYWEGFSIFYDENLTQHTIDKLQCVLVFFTERTKESKTAMDILEKSLNNDAARIIQIFLGSCTVWPEELREKLHDRQAIIQSLCSEKEFTGKIRDSLRQFGCCLGHPRGFDVKKRTASVELVQFHPTGFLQVVIPKTFFIPPMPITHIGMKSFCTILYVTDIIIPEGVTFIANGAFYSCTSLINITIPDSVVIIEEKAFYNCVSLTNITIPLGITSINKEVFAWCKSLTKIIIPEKVSEIGNNAFEDCKSLVSITIYDSVTYIGNDVFKGCQNLTIYTPPNSTAWRYAKNNNINCKPMMEPEPSSTPLSNPIKPRFFDRFRKRGK